MKTIISIVIAVLLGAAGAYMLLDKKSQSRVIELEAEMKSLGDESKSLRDQLFGYTRYTDYLAPGKKVMTEQAKFLAAKVVRNYQLVENLQAGWLGLKSNASVVIPYSVEYSFGYDLKASDFELNATPNGLEIKLGKPVLVAAPAVTPGSL